MVNTNVQSPIPLAGRGFTARHNDIYDAGEYPSLSNVFIKDQKLISRNGFNFPEVSISGGSWGSPFYSLGGGESQHFSNLTGFIGSTHATPNVLSPTVVGKNGMFHIVETFNSISRFYQKSNRYSPESIQAGTDTDFDFTYPVKQLTQPEGTPVTLTMKTVFSGSTITGYQFYYASGDSGGTLPSFTAIGPVMPAKGLPEFFIDAFFFKSRLWIVTVEGVYFSGVGSANYTNFTAPVGGFFKFSSITSVQALKDTIYVFNSTNVYALTYGTDPNIDAVNTNITNSIGGGASCVYDGLVYFTDSKTLYAVNNNSVSKVFDLNLYSKTFVYNPCNTATAPIVRYKLVPYNNKILIIFWASTLFTLLSSNTPVVNRGIKVPTTVYDSTYWGFAPIPQVDVSSNDLTEAQEHFNNAFFLDMDEGTVTRLVFRDQRQLLSRNIPMNGYIVDAVSGRDSNGINRLFVMTSAHRTPPGIGAADPEWADRNNTNNFIYIYNEDASEINNDSRTDTNKVFDYYYMYNKNAGTLSQNFRSNIPLHVVIKEFTPDGNEYLIKKFRGLNVMGSIPSGVKMQFVFDGNEYDDGNSFSLTNRVGAHIRPNSYRFGINQRARSLSVILSRPDTGVTGSVVTENNDVLTIEDMRLYWTYTSKMQNTKGGAGTPAQPL